MPFVAAALSDSVAAEATTQHAPAPAPATMRPQCTACEAIRLVMRVDSSRQKLRWKRKPDAHVLEADELEALQPLILDVAGDAVLELRREAAGQTPVRLIGIVGLHQDRRRARRVRIVGEAHAEHVDVVLELAHVVDAQVRQQHTPRQVPRVRESQSDIAGQRLELLFVIDQVQAAGAAFGEAVDRRVDVEEAEVR